MSTTASELTTIAAVAGLLLACTGNKQTACSHTPTPTSTTILLLVLAALLCIYSFYRTK